MQRLTQRLHTAAELDAAFAEPRYLLFKHSTRCNISADAFAEFQRWSTAHPDAAAGWIDVIEQRDLARAVAERTGIRHQSPQAILLEAGEATWDASHGAITQASLEEIVTKAGTPRSSR